MERMSELRKRIPFKMASDSTSESDERVILDEQEQEEVIQRLKDENSTWNQRHRILLQAMLGLSCLLEIIYLINPESNPISSAIPSTSSEQDHPLPFTSLLTVLALLLHLNLALLISPSKTISDAAPFLPISFFYVFICSAVPPFLCILTGRTWQMTVWWSVTGTMSWVVYSVRRMIDQADESLVALEKMKYASAGA
ncbi:hypothetical protein SERLA73DRAFT_169246 [Serpula lacrymans var. lacrymans S7.3]|uniref:Uncharacterized protein n=2 Tax=Serpula lacrymans var. lacrymans TaxID=341189 RepID=F8Q1P4_SERL3|nr:uncharacterized protein SERLADRAFT_470148 [Serpula lacrymans var. lacrymans S7.9]EGN98222.1 hypothetical protein SERLA73DRAFT_169246 [Serpula lacrymans var. lacrymans S7.3]EGO23796.1 hypothetical protein SERLADRAFT_470148 [Serpula lacrymans var. lacrymans S7.9]